MDTSTLHAPRPNDAESKYEANQRLTAFGAIVGSIGLAIQHLFSVAHFHGWPTTAITLAALGGWIVFGTGVIRNRMLGKTKDGKAFIEYARSDERLRTLQFKAFTTGFFAMLGMQVLFIVLFVLMGNSDGGFLTVLVAAPATIAAGVTGAVLRYQLLSSR